MMMMRKVQLAVALVMAFLLGALLRPLLLTGTTAMVHVARRVRPCPEHCRLRDTRLQESFSLVAFLSIRLFRRDPHGLTTRDFFEWLHAMRWAGVDRVVVFDSFSDPEERQLVALQPFIDAGFVEWHDWSARNPYHFKKTQTDAYDEAFLRYGNRTKFIITTDIDEYPGSSKARVRQGYLLQELERIVAENPKVGAIYLENYGFLAPAQDSFWPEFRSLMMLERSWQRTLVPMNYFGKYVAVAAALEPGPLRLHEAVLKRGYVAVSDPKNLYLAHYWLHRRGRLIGNNRETAFCDDMEPLRDALSDCVLACSEPNFVWRRGEQPAFWDETNPKTQSKCFLHPGRCPCDAYECGQRIPSTQKRPDPNKYYPARFTRV